MFFYELFLNSLLCLFPVLFYQFFISKISNRKNKDHFVSFCLGLMFLLLIIYGAGPTKYLFLEIPLFIGFVKQRKVFCSFLTVFLSLYVFITLQVHIALIISIILIYLLIFFLSKDNHIRMLRFLLIAKAFFISLVSFYLFPEFHPLIFVYLLGLVLYFYSFLSISLTLISSLANDISLNMIESEKRIFRITHEIKNPIAVCKGYLDMLDTNNQEKVNKYVPIIKSEISRTLTIMDDFLNLGKLVIKREILDICFLIEDVEKITKQLLRFKKVELVVPNFDYEYYIYGDYDRLKQVFINIMKNAEEANAKIIRIEVKPATEGIHISINDDGEGIPKTALSRVGEVFFTTKPYGTGIGVNISKEIVKLHKGKLSYISDMGKGTTVNIFLPTEKDLNFEH